MLYRIRNHGLSGSAHKWNDPLAICAVAPPRSGYFRSARDPSSDPIALAGGSATASVAKRARSKNDLLARRFRNRINAGCALASLLLDSMMVNPVFHILCK